MQVLLSAAVSNIVCLVNITIVNIVILSTKEALDYVEMYITACKRQGYPATSASY